MIALPSALPYIQIGRETFAACHPEWIDGRLQNAAKETQVPEWLATDIAKGVCMFLQNHYDGSVIEVGDLFDQIRLTLNKLGFSEMAETLEDTPPPISISLSDLARRAGTGYELAFFRLLESRLDNAAQGGAQQVNCYGLKNGVKRLTEASKWTRRCESLKNEITVFLDQRHRHIADDVPSLKLSLCE